MPEMRSVDQACDVCVCLALLGLVGASALLLLLLLVFFVVLVASFCFVRASVCCSCVCVCVLVCVSVHMYHVHNDPSEASQLRRNSICDYGYSRTALEPRGGINLRQCYTIAYCRLPLGRPVSTIVLLCVRSLVCAQSMVCSHSWTFGIRQSSLQLVSTKHVCMCVMYVLMACMFC